MEDNLEIPGASIQVKITNYEPEIKSISEEGIETEAQLEVPDRASIKVYITNSEPRANANVSMLDRAIVQCKGLC